MFTVTSVHLSGWVFEIHKNVFPNYAPAWEGGFATQLAIQTTLSLIKEIHSLPYPMAKVNICPRNASLMGSWSNMDHPEHMP